MTGELAYRWAGVLYPICRSLTGSGVRQTLAYIKTLLPNLQIKEVPTGTQAFDWTVPQEWNIRDAFIEIDGVKVVDFKQHNLHIMGYSEPIDATMSFAELDKHLYSLPESPDAIPYITSYYKRRWGFCLSERQRAQLRKQPNKQCRVYIDSELIDGHLSYGELLLQGETNDEILLTANICHPSLANNELSAPVVATAIAQWLETAPRRFSYRILYLPETIGSIVYLFQHLEWLKKHLIAGFVLSCIGDNGDYSHVASRYGDTLADRVAKYALEHITSDYKEYSFLQRGSDERQFCSPGVELPVCGLCRTKYGEYPEYHTSLDDMSFISPAGLQGGINLVKNCIVLLENNRVYKNVFACEAQLGKRGLYPTVSTKDSVAQTRDMMNLLAYADGTNDLMNIADIVRASPFSLIDVANRLVEAGVIREVV
ncbi:DUF4910 domain-containing protein [Deferribacterales bacterium RsTz2092]|nr:aminopeptidase [Deferribacterales bacterium]